MEELPPKETDLLLEEFGVTRNRWPGTHVTHVERRHLPTLRSNYVITDKSDGVRHLMALSDRGVFLVDRAFKARRIGPAPESGPRPLLDGELVVLRGSAQAFLVYDCLFPAPLMDRLARASEVVSLLKARTWVYDGKPLYISVKKMVDGRKAREFLEVAKSLPYPLDGFVMTPVDAPLVAGTSDLLLKWKSTVTVDFACRKASGDAYDLLLASGERIGSMTPKGMDALMMGLLCAEGKTRIIECSYDQDKKLWRPVRARDDKDRPNSKFVYNNSLKNIRENITLEEVVEALTSPPQ